MNGIIQCLGKDGCRQVFVQIYSGTDIVNVFCYNLENIQNLLRI